MPQEKKPEQTLNPKSRKLRVSNSEEQPKCYIHDESVEPIIKSIINYIRENVCINDEPLIDFEGKHYCLFHLPTKEKDVKKFEEKFRAQLKAVEEKLAAIEELPIEKQENAKKQISYNFRYFWFPSDVDLVRYKFSADAYFTSATFSAAAMFNSAKFLADAYFTKVTFSANTNFSSANFLANTYFSSTTFSADAYFSEATFSANANFILATFSADAYFTKATFSANAYFRSATFSDVIKFNFATFSANTNFSDAAFSANAYFNNTKFTEIGNTEFTEANFAKDVFFDETEFRNEVNFNAAIFGKDSDVFFRETLFAKNVNFQYCTSEGYLRFSKLRGNEYQFDFQEAAFEKATRISFHTARLCPNWFVNVDSQKFVFTDIRWQNLRSDRKNRKITAELDNLEARGTKEQNKRLLEIAARQLAVNAEENNRYEEAANFRYMAMEIKRLEERKHFRFSRYLTWLYKWTSGYGENWGWAAVMLIAILFSFGLLYAIPLVKFDYGEKANEHIIFADTIEKPEDWTKKYDARFHSMNIGEGLVHSLYVAALQRPEPKPENTLTRLFIILETIFAPLQAALLALAIRRKFMR